MRYFITLFSLLCLPLAAVEEKHLHVTEDEVKTVDHLIEATAQKLEQQKELKALMLLFQQQEERFFRGDESKEHAAKMVRSARQILDLIQKAHLEHLFTSEYLEELALFSSIAGKNAHARP